VMTANQALPEALCGPDNGIRTATEGQAQEIADELDRYYCEAAAQVDALGLRDWPMQIGHSDWHPGNMLFDGPKVVIDHHVSQDDLGSHVFKDSTAEATGRLILELAEAAQVSVVPAMATPLFAAIATDTGWFRFSSVTETTFQALARLVAAGASPPGIFSALYEQHSLARLHLRGRMLERIEIDPSGRLLWTEVTAEDFRITGALRTDTEEVINQLHTVAGSEVAAMFTELEDGTTKVSLRSKSDFDVRRIAAQFGGGGHTAASGITFHGSLAEARKVVLEAVLAALQIA
jgi:phosphoesterase RecJ-like protein